MPGSQILGCQVKIRCFSFGMNMTLGHFQLLSYTSVYSLVMLTLKLVLQCLIQEKYQLTPVNLKQTLIFIGNTWGKRGATSRASGKWKHFNSENPWPKWKFCTEDVFQSWNHTSKTKWITHVIICKKVILFCKLVNRPF